MMGSQSFKFLSGLFVQYSVDIRFIELAHHLDKKDNHKTFIVSHTRKFTIYLYIVVYRNGGSICKLTPFLFYFMAS